MIKASSTLKRKVYSITSSLLEKFSYNELNFERKVIKLRRSIFLEKLESIQFITNIV